MAKQRPLEQAIPDLEAHLQESFNRLIKTTMRRLATKKRSPVWTGFFASSWKAQLSPVQPQDRVENFAPWAEIAERKADASWDGRTVPKDYVIKPRFYPPGREFNYKRGRVYIGNSARYAIYALESGRVQSFIQGPEMSRLVKEEFRERKAPLSVAFTTKQGKFGLTADKDYISYQEL